MSSRRRCVSLVAFMAIGGSLFGAGGCVANDISLVITHFADPDPAQAMSNICSYDPMNSPISPRGTFDVSLANQVGTGYTAGFIMVNELEARTDVDVDTQAYYVKSFDVELVLSGSKSAQASIPASKRAFSYTTSSTRMGPGDSAAFQVNVISKDFVAMLASLPDTPPNDVVVRIRAVATRGEEEHAGAWAELPIDICHGCLTGTGTDALPKCPITNIQTPAIGNVCNYAADVPVDCCTVAGSTQVLCGNATKPTT